MRDPNLHDITNFVEAKSRVSNHPIFGKVQGDQKPFNQKSNWKQKKDAKSFAAQGQGQSQQQKQLSNSEERKELTCPSCQKDHWLSQCNEFKKLSLYNRYQLVRSKHLCIKLFNSWTFCSRLSKEKLLPRRRMYKEAFYIPSRETITAKTKQYR